MTSEAILTELRALPGAPDRLRERVRVLPEPKPRVAWSLPRVGLRRTFLVLAPAVLAVAFGAAALHGVFAGGSSGQPVADSQKVIRGAARFGATTTTPVYSPHVESGAAGTRIQLHSSQGATALPPSATRLNRY